MKKFILLIIISFFWGSVLSSERKAPSIIQALGREAQADIGIPEDLHDEIFVDDSLADGSALAYFNRKNKKIYVAGWTLKYLKQAPIGVLRITMYHEVAHKLVDCEKRPYFPSAVEEDRFADVKAVVKCSCYQCVQEYKQALSDLFLSKVFKERGIVPLASEINDFFEKRALAGGYLSFEELDEEACELRKADQLCKYHAGPKALVILRFGN